jgi:thiol-disulfide isomerase/thioredoxin
MFARHIIAAVLLSTILPLAGAQVPAQPAPNAPGEASTQTELRIGQLAPPLAIAKWVKGSPVATFERGKVYVVEFWAASCENCIICLPHLSELQRTYADKGVTIIGVSSMERGNTLEAVEAMVVDKSDVMEFTVAWDANGKTNDAYVKALGPMWVHGCFLIDKAGVIVFAGHPKMLQVPLKHVVAGTWDIEKGNNMLAEYGVALDAVRSAPRSNPNKALMMLSELETQFPDFVGVNKELHFDLLLRAGDTEAATTFGTKWLEAAIGTKDWQSLNYIAWWIVDPEVDRAHRDLELAMRAAAKAAELTKWKDGRILDTLARVHAWKGDFAKAIEVQEKAIEHANEQLKAVLARSLEEYHAASRRKSSR